MTIATILSTKGSEIVSIAADAPIRDAVSELADRRIGALLVLDGDSVLGVFSERDLVHCLKERGAEVLDWPVSRGMTAPAVQIDLETPVLAALAIMTQRRFRHLPVVSGGRLQGIVSIGDLVKFRIEQIERESEAMRTYISGDRY
jgi:CBS domain-containing protein